MDDNDEEYTVGYCKPPKHTRFKKGQSGNPSGKKQKLDKYIPDIILDVLNEKISVVINGKKKKARKIEAIIRRMVQKGLEADHRFSKFIIEMAQQSQNYKQEIESHAEWVRKMTRELEEFERENEGKEV